MTRWYHNVCRFCLRTWKRICSTVRTFSNHDTINSCNKPIIANLKRTKNWHSRINQLRQPWYLCLHEDVFALSCCLRLKNRYEKSLEMITDYDTSSKAQTCFATLPATTAALATYEEKHNIYVLIKYTWVNIYLHLKDGRHNENLHLKDTYYQHWRSEEWGGWGLRLRHLAKFCPDCGSCCKIFRSSCPGSRFGLSGI